MCFLQAPSSLLEALEDHLKTLESNRKGGDKEKASKLVFVLFYQLFLWLETVLYRVK